MKGGKKGNSNDNKRKRGGAISAWTKENRIKMKGRRKGK